MKILGINGSPRIGGNTDLLLDRALKGVLSCGAEAEKVVLNKLKFSPCQECDKVRDDGICKIEDDFQSLYRKIKNADAIILASPIFFGSLTAQTKMMIDRFQCLWRARYLINTLPPSKKRPGIFISVEASQRKDFFENAKAIVKNFFATIDVEYRRELLCSGVDEKGVILKHTDILKQAFELGKSIVDFKK